MCELSPVIEMNPKSAALCSNHGIVAICSISLTVVLRHLQPHFKLSVQDAFPDPLVKGSRARVGAGQVFCTKCLAQEMQ